MSIKKFIKQRKEYDELYESVDLYNENLEVIEILIKEVSMFFGVLEKYKDLQFHEIIKKDVMISRNDKILYLNCSNIYSDLSKFILVREKYFNDIFNSSFDGYILKNFLSYFGIVENNKKTLKDFINDLDLKFEQKINLLGRESLYEDLKNVCSFALEGLKNESEDEKQKYLLELEVKKDIENVLDDKQRIKKIHNKKIEELNNLKVGILTFLSVIGENIEDTILYSERLGLVTLSENIKDLLETNSSFFQDNIYTTYLLQLLEFVSFKKDFPENLEENQYSGTNYLKTFVDYNNLFDSNYKSILYSSEINGNFRQLLEEDYEIFKNNKKEFIAKVMGYFEVAIDFEIKTLEI